MSIEFHKVAPNSVKSDRGFTVTWLPSGGVNYSDESGTVRVDSEVLTRPPRILVYSRSGALKGMPAGRAEEIVANIVRAIEFLGHQVERT